MASIPVIVKHQGKKHHVEVDPSSNGETFKHQLFSITGVEPERQKIIVKGGQLKDDTDMSKLGLKPNQTLMMMGSPSAEANTIEKPKEKIRFLEDMDEAEAAQLEGATPAGLQNLGNTCYLNSTLQTLRSIPDLQEELLEYIPRNDGSSARTARTLSEFGLGGLGATVDLTAALRDLFKEMSETQQGFPPLMFLNALRTAFPQFAQKSKDGHYAQQDAEEAWSQIVSQLRRKLRCKLSKPNAGAAEPSWVDKYMTGKSVSVMECDEPSAKEAGEESVIMEDLFFKLDCHINVETNHLRDGLSAGLKEQIKKHSEALGRDALYTKTARIARLPKYLPIHFLRFDWRRDTSKKAKIMRKVTFPEELDALEFCTDDLRKLLVPIRDKIREVRKEEQDVERARKRQRRVRAGEENDAGPSVSTKEPLQKKKEADQKKEDAKKPAEDTEMAEVEYKTDAQIDAERAASILQAKKELLALVDPTMTADDGANQTGLYELRGVITHQGASADSGHYTSFVKKQGPMDPVTGKRKEEDGTWWWFNDEKVSEVDAERIQTLSGGGQSHSALILLYRAVPLPTIDEDVKMSEA